MSRAVAGVIVLYQRHVSPRKGYGCPLRVLRGRASCAEFARRAVHRVGVVRLLPLLRRRFAQCAAALRAAGGSPERPARGDPAAGPPPLDYEGPRPPPDRKEKRLRRSRGSHDGRRWTACDWCDLTGDVLCCPFDLDCGPPG